MDLPVQNPIWPEAAALDIFYGHALHFRIIRACVEDDEALAEQDAKLLESAH